jgi:Protein of unknown function (DUF3631)
MSAAARLNALLAVERDPMLDECDAILDRSNGSTEPLRALLNAGNRRGTSVPRCVGPTQKLFDFAIFCPKVLAGIGEIPGTVKDRSIVVRMSRKRPDETVLRFRRREALKIAEPIEQAFASWAQDAVGDLELARPVVPGDPTTVPKNPGNRCSRSPSLPKANGRLARGMPHMSSPPAARTPTRRSARCC